MSSIIFERTIQRIQIERNTGTYRIVIGGERPATVNAVTTPDGSAPRLVALTQTEYDALEAVDASTVYIIKSDA